MREADDETYAMQGQYIGRQTDGNAAGGKHAEGQQQDGFVAPVGQQGGDDRGADGGAQGIGGDG